MKLTVDERFLGALVKNNIFQARTGMRRGHPGAYVHRLKSGDVLSFARDTAIEEFATFADGNVLFSTGSFASLTSGLPYGSKAGRYDAIGGGGSTFGYRHPIEAVCMNSAVFNFSRENVHPYFLRYERENGPITKNPVPTPQPHQAGITLGHDVWIGANVVLKGGITIGNGAVVAARSIVTKDVEPYAVVAGQPATFKKYRFSRDIIERLEETKFWEYELGDMYRYGAIFDTPPPPIP